MKTVERKVYYCEFCKRHRLTKDSIEKHEPRCIYNPQRSVCGWHKDDEPEAPSTYVSDFVDDPDVDRLRKETDGCPACMLAVIVQSRGAGLGDEDAWDFDYKAEVERFRKEEQFSDVW